eukprot:CAMPEP_0197910380 /NCGR_PEP_ID=MMETSP1439-20131203/70791_1 /TAXON_ID=66791 /ORGANISM="Gonyaulax spinifera, Strain CCMP409" /LENGTH=115 /DNA_ID=CAMNT_0043532031 /DNA_START=1 /DNA_END=345 /DNA_ORIENTATION=+
MWSMLFVLYALDVVELPPARALDGVGCVPHVTLALWTHGYPLLSCRWPPTDNTALAVPVALEVVLELLGAVGPLPRRRKVLAPLLAAIAAALRSSHLYTSGLPRWGFSLARLRAP